MALTAERLAPNRVAETFLDSLSRADHQTEPYDHWFLSGMLPDDVTDAIAEMPVKPADISNYSGYRNTEDDKRVYFNPETNARFPVCGEVAAAFDTPEVRSALEAACGIDLSPHRLRIEYCQDTDGFWLEPHCDILVKKFTMLVYLSRDPALYDAGTDIFSGPPDHELLGTAPYEFNKGLIFIPGTDTWHGFSQRPVKGIRKSLIINYVADEWRERWELAQGK